MDSSAILALLWREKGADMVAAHLDNAVISAVNLQEVYKKLFDGGLGEQPARETVALLGLDIRDHDGEAALAAAAFHEQTGRYGSGLGDRSCMSLALQEGLPVLTADKAWAKIDVPGLKIMLLR